MSLFHRTILALAFAAVFRRPRRQPNRFRVSRPTRTFTALPSIAATRRIS